MLENLKNHIEKFVEIRREDYAEILTYFTAIEVAKKENLLLEGKICKYNYFVNKGCLRMFFINEKGVEQTIQFALETGGLLTIHLSLRKSLLTFISRRLKNLK